MIDNGNCLRRLIGGRSLVKIVMVAACFLCLKGAVAGPIEASDATTEVVATLNAGLLATMKAGRAKPFATRYAQLAPLIERVFDLPGILTDAVGPRWAALAPEDHARLLDAFRRYTVSTYAANFSNYGGERFVILPDRRRVGEQVVVPTQIVPLSGKPARLDYVLSSVGGEGGTVWKITDIMLDRSISQVAVQRSDFRGLLRDGGAAQLILTLDRKTADLSGSTSGPPLANVPLERPN